jgi:hypothetical protein
MHGGTYSAAKHGLIYIYIYILKHGGPLADGGHPGGRRTGGQADTPAGSGQGGALYYGWAYILTLWGKGGYYTEGAPTWRQGRCINSPALVHVGAKRREGEGVVVRPHDT